jgi:hypothetical protein
MRNASIASGSLTDRLHAVAIALAGCRDRLARHHGRGGVARPRESSPSWPRVDRTEAIRGVVGGSRELAVSGRFLLAILQGFW